ncbi:hypothetical protein LM701042_130057 [Listeria monocytogenes]|nr:hypothetical protein LM600444_130057 [Listeria monocytogenes]CUK95908.1 hypothetical protein LM701042_130057 [Listeria monocytogenes]
MMNINFFIEVTGALVKEELINIKD